MLEPGTAIRRHRHLKHPPNVFPQACRLNELCVCIAELELSIRLLLDAAGVVDASDDVETHAGALEAEWPLGKIRMKRPPGYVESTE